MITSLYAGRAKLRGAVEFTLTGTKSWDRMIGRRV
jgi:hypothetical protein